MKPPGLTTHKKTIGILLFGVIVVWVTAYLTDPGLSSSNYKFAYCRNCEKESVHVPGQPLPLCQKCGNEMIGLADSIKKIGKPKNSHLPMIVAYGIEAIIALGLLYYFTKPPAHPTNEEEEHLYMRCPHCSRKLRYRESQQGNLGQCPLCKRALKFPVQTVDEIL